MVELVLYSKFRIPWTRLAAQAPILKTSVPLLDVSRSYIDIYADSPESLVLLDLSDQSGESISPTLTHSSSLSVSETSTVHRTTSDSGRQTV